MIASGLQRGTTAAYDDLGPADTVGGIRALVALPVRDPDVLEATIAAIYEPSSPAFRHYLTVEQWLAAHAPELRDAEAVAEWLESEGLEVARVATNRLVLEVTGTVGAFDATFRTRLHTFAKVDDPEFRTFGTQSDLIVPSEVAERIESVVVADPPADTSPLPDETGAVVDQPPDTTRLTLGTVGRAYGFDTMSARGFSGRGVAVGVVVGAGFKFNDVKSFWRSQRIERADPRLIVTMEPPSTRFTETTLDIEWVGGLAPGADVVVYAGPDAHDSSLVYTFNAAIADGRVAVVTDSFAHREDVTPRAIRSQYHASAQMAAALGMTVVAAAGDSARADVPSSSPYVTSVGGTVLELDVAGMRARETAWESSGSGDSLTFEVPSWQVGLAIGSHRAISDIALASGNGYWVYAFGEWKAFTGTSFAAPVVAGMLAVIDEARRAGGKPDLGFLNSILYTTPSVQAAFLDIVDGATADHMAMPGWDYPTGWGSPDAAALADLVP